MRNILSMEFEMKLVSTVKRILVVGLLGIAFISCKEEKLGDVEEILGLGGDKWVPGPIDNWLDDSLVTPYNIAVSYKWNQFEYGELTTILTPVDEANVIPLMSAVRKAWINPYVEEAGIQFFNKYSPKFFVLSGSYRFYDNGTYQLGQAEGGRKVLLLGVNSFRVRGMPGYTPADTTFLKDRVIRTMQHEFGHILHMNIMYSPDYRQISAGKYQGGNWINYNNSQALRDGFITAYAMSGFDDDFVEMISMMLVEGRAGFDRIINSIPEGTSENGVTKAVAQQALRRKEAMVVDYYKKAWNTDFYKLQTKSRKALEGLF